jgi:hypothetical protein
MSPADGDSGVSVEGAPLAGGSGRFGAPIGGPDRAGEDPRLTEEFESIGVELGKIGGVEQEPVDWQRVADLSEHLLTQVTKDLRCGVYWTVAQFFLRGLKEFSSAVQTLADLLTVYGAEIFPRRPKGRFAASVWFAERLEEALEKNQVELTGDELQAIRAPIEQCISIFRDLELDAGAFEAAAASLSKISTIASQEEREEEIRRAFPDGFAEVGLAMLGACGPAGDDAHTPLKLRMRRWALWMALPTALDAEKLDCVVAHEEAEELERLFEANKWPELLQRSEEVFMSSPFWLDLSFWSARAASFASGPPAEAAIIGELRALVSRSPEVVDRTDRNGHELASARVREWLSLSVLAADGGDSIEEPASVTLPVELNQLMGQGRMREAMAAASEWITPTYGRVRFARSVALANAFNEFGAVQESFMVFRGLHSQLRQLTVREWEPRLFAACIEGYLASKKRAMGLGPEDEPLLEELSTLDPTAVMGVLSG